MTFKIRFWHSLTVGTLCNNFLWVCWFLAKNFVILFEIWQPILTYFQVHFQQKPYLWRSLDLWFYWFGRINWWVFGSFHWLLFLWLCYTVTRCSFRPSCILFLTQLDRIVLIITVWGIAIGSMYDKHAVAAKVWIL